MIIIIIKKNGGESPPFGWLHFDCEYQTGKWKIPQCQSWVKWMENGWTRWAWEKEEEEEEEEEEEGKESVTERAASKNRWGSVRGGLAVSRQASRRPEETQIKGKRETDRQTERKGKRRDKRENKWRASGAPRGWKEADTFYDFYPDHQHHHPPPFFSLLSFIPSSPPGHSIFTFLFGCLPILRRILLPSPSPSPPPLDAFSLSLSVSHLLLFLIF